RLRLDRERPLHAASPAGGGGHRRLRRRARRGDSLAALAWPDRRPRRGRSVAPPRPRPAHLHGELHRGGPRPRALRRERRAPAAHLPERRLGVLIGLERGRAPRHKELMNRSLASMIGFSALVALACDGGAPTPDAGDATDSGAARSEEGR